MSSDSLQKLTNALDSRALESLGHLLAGGTSGAIALFILYPIEQMNTRSTVISQARIITPRTILDDFLHLRIENIADIYRGLSFGIFERFTFNGIYFFFYSLLKNDWKRRYSTKQNPREMPMAVALFRGSLAGILTQLFTSPLSTIQKVLQTTHSADTRNANASMIIRNVSSQHGIAAFWSGFGMSMALVINPAINMYCYEYLRRSISKLLGGSSAAIDFMAGLLSKAIATVLCYPLIYIKYNQQADNAADEDASRRSIVDIVRATLRDEGAKGFYKGIETKIVQSSLNNAVMFMIKEKVVVYTFAMMVYIASKRKEMQRVHTETKRAVSQ